MVLNVIVDCFAFLVLSSAVVFGFGLALHILHRHATEEAEPDHNDDDEKQGDFTGDYGSLHKSLLTLFYALFGSFDADVSLPGQSSLVSILCAVPRYGRWHDCTFYSLLRLLHDRCSHTAVESSHRYHGRHFRQDKEFRGVPEVDGEG